jgi:hypothetical protein
MYTKITPADQEFDRPATDAIIVRALRVLTDQSFFIYSEENGVRFYECVLYIKDEAFALSTRTNRYKWELVNSLYLQQNLRSLVATSKLTEAQYAKKRSEFQMRNPSVYPLTTHDELV